MMNTQYLSQLIALIVFTVSTSKAFSSEKNSNDFRDLNTLLAEIKDITDITHQWRSTHFHAKPADCAEILENGMKLSGMYEIYPRNRIIPCETLEVYCDMVTDGGGWTVLQRRGDYKRSKDYFYKDWEEYKFGFGNLNDEFWLGNDNIYALTNQKKYSARFDLGDVEDETAYAHYDNFWIENEQNLYKLHITDCRGTAGDSMQTHHKMFFTTKDKDNDKYPSYNCAHYFKGGWWYNACLDANLNGLYQKGYDNGKERANLTVWKAWKGTESLETVEIKIRPKYFEKWR